MVTVRVQTAPFDQANEIDALLDSQKGGGGLVTFQGLVRMKNGPVSIRSLTLEIYPGMTERVVSRFAHEAKERFHLDACLVIHRYGRLLPGEPIVLVATHAPHRQAAFESACYIMDHLKTRAPFWKYEETDRGGRWIEQNSADIDAVRSWHA